MLTITINKEEHQIPNRPEELSLRRFLELLDVENKAPDKYKALQKCSNPIERKAIIDSITTLEYEGQFLDYFANWLVALTKVPKTVWMGQKVDFIERLYNHFHGAFLPPADIQLPKSVEIKGETFYFPENLMIKSTLGEFTQSAQLQSIAEEEKGNYLQSMPKVLCILLRKEGEEYSPALMERVEFFKECPMNIVWLVDFFLQRQSNICGVALKICSMMGEVERSASN